MIRAALDFSYFAQLDRGDCFRFGFGLGRRTLAGSVVLCPQPKFHTRINQGKFISRRFEVSSLRPPAGDDRKGPRRFCRRRLSRRGTLDCTKRFYFAVAHTTASHIAEESAFSRPPRELLNGSPEKAHGRRFSALEKEVALAVTTVQHQTLLKQPPPSREADASPHTTNVPISQWAAVRA